MIKKWLSFTDADINLSAGIHDPDGEDITV